MGKALMNKITEGLEVCSSSSIIPTDLNDKGSGGHNIRLLKIWDWFHIT